MALSRGLSCLAWMLGNVCGARLGARRHQADLKVAATCGMKRDLPISMLDANISIINGRPAPECAWPWQIYLGGCGGTLVAPQWVLSAAHCSTPDFVYAGLRDKYNTSQGQKRNVTQRIDHPAYRNPGLDHDLMLLELDEPFELNECVNTACLPSAKPQEGDADFWITGWGSTGGTSSPRVLQEASVNIVGPCDVHLATETDVCVFGSSGETACFGDSGGPLVKKENGWWTVFGATSRGSNPCGGTTVYAGVYDAMDWIVSYVGVQPTPAPTPPPPPTPAPTPAPTSAPTPCTDCCDGSPSCPGWADAGMCSGWMMDFCCLSCTSTAAVAQ